MRIHTAVLTYLGGSPFHPLLAAAAAAHARLALAAGMALAEAGKGECRFAAAEQKRQRRKVIVAEQEPCFKRFSTQLRVVIRLVEKKLRVSDAAVRRRPLLLSCDLARRAREKTQSDSAHLMRGACVFACMRAVYLK